MKKVSIIVPVYNTKKFLNRCLDSLVYQTYKNLQIIVVDDGSTDGSDKILDDYAKRYPVILALHKKNGGVSCARNLALSKVDGDYIYFCDSDDFVESNTISDMVSAIENNNVDMVYAGYYIDKPQQKLVYQPFDNSFILSLTDVDKFAEIFGNKHVDMSCLWNKLYKKQLITSHFDENLNFGEDQIFNLDYYRNIKNIYFLAKPLYHYVIHEQQTVARSRQDRCIKRQKLYDKQMQFAKDMQCERLKNVFGKEFVLDVARNTIWLKDQISRKELKKFFKEMCNTYVVKDALKFVRGETKKEKLMIYLVRHKCFMLITLLGSIYQRSKRGL